MGSKGIIAAILSAGALIAGAIIFVSLQDTESPSGLLPTSTESLSPTSITDDFLGTADRICADLGDQVASLGDAETFEAISKQASRIAEWYRSAISDLSALPAPPGKEADVAEWLAAMEDVVAANDRQAAAAFSHDLQDFDEAGAVFHEATSRMLTRARVLGLDACANSAATNESLQN